MLTVSREQAAHRRHGYTTPSGAAIAVDTYIGTNLIELTAQGRTPADAGPGLAHQPMAFLVDQSPNSTVQPHYHAAAQFQVFVGGGGRIGTHPVEVVSVHYAGPHSPYGPILAGPEGVRYLTLRRRWDPGARWMPEAAAELRALPNRRHVAYTSPALPRRVVGSLSEPEREAALEGNDGMAAWLLRAGPGGPLEIDPSPGGGTFCYVIGGALQAGGALLQEGACVFLAEDEPAVQGEAGPGGVELVQLQFPRGS